MFGLGVFELILVLLVVLILFGPKNLPKIGKAMGEGIKEFKNGVKEIEKNVSVEDKNDEKNK